MRLRLRFSFFFMVSLLCFLVYMGLVIGLILEYIFPILGLDNSGEDLTSFFIVFFLPFISGGLFLGLYLVGPMLLMMSMIARLSMGDYDLSKADDRFFTNKGKLKRRYFLYREAITDLYHLALTLEQAETQRKKLEEAKENWIRGISHDLKTPLSYIVGYSALLTTTAYDWRQEEIQSFANEIYTKGKSIEDLIGDLRRSFQSVNADGELPLSKERFDLIPFLQALIADIANMPGAENYELNFQTLVTTLLITADKKLLYRAFQNLLINAVYHNPRHTQITVKVDAPQAGMVCIHFGDNGMGVGAMVIEKISNHEIVSNQAHGLDIVKSIIASHQGNISVESKDNEGSLFHIQLPMLP